MSWALRFLGPLQQAAARPYIMRRPEKTADQIIDRICNYCSLISGLRH